MIRRASAPEADRLAKLHAEAFDHPWDDGTISGLLALPGVVALSEDAGFILIRVVADEAEILTLAVSPAARRQGLGRRLVAAASEAAAAEGAESLFLEVAADNAAAIALYDGAGFESAGRRASYYARAGGAEIDALVLKKALSATA
jgi:ribosomal-protein-alanine N-acetyltransferase